MLLPPRRRPKAPKKLARFPIRLFGRDRGDRGDRWIVIGLGNPGEKYASTRHNIGAMVVEELAGRDGAALKRHKSGCLVAEVTLGSERTVLARPMSFMNESGRPVRELIRWYKADLDRTTVVHDEIDIPFGEIRVKVGGGTAGHNGLGSLVSHLKSNGFIRVRVGVGRPRGAAGAADHVLAGFSAAERKELPFLLDRAGDAVVKVVTTGADRAMNEVNTR